MKKIISTLFILLGVLMAGIPALAQGPVTAVNFEGGWTRGIGRIRNDALNFTIVPETPLNNFLTFGVGLGYEHIYSLPFPDYIKKTNLVRDLVPFFFRLKAYTKNAKRVSFIYLDAGCAVDGKYMMENMNEEYVDDVEASKHIYGVFELGFGSDFYVSENGSAYLKCGLNFMHTKTPDGSTLSPFVSIKVGYTLHLLDE